MAAWLHKKTKRRQGAGPCAAAAPSKLPSYSPRRPSCASLLIAALAFSIVQTATVSPLQQGNQTTSEIAT
jgi:hypothetical protein